MKKHKKHTIKKKAKRKPYKFDRARKNQWLKQYEGLRSITAACQAVGIGRTLIRTTIKDDKDFAERKDQIDDILVDALESRLFNILLKDKNPHPALFIFTLCNLRPIKWKQKMVHTGDPKEPITYRITDAGRKKC